MVTFVSLEINSVTVVVLKLKNSPREGAQVNIGAVAKVRAGALV